MFQRHSHLYASVQKRETLRLEIMMRFTKYSIKELKQIFPSIDVESEARRILTRSGGIKVKHNGLLHQT